MNMIGLFLVMAQAWAGGSVVENGGGVVRCASVTEDSNIFHSGIATIDLFEGQEHFRLNYSTLASFRGQSLEVAFPKTIRRFFRHSSGMQHRLLKMFGTFSSSLFVADHSLPNLNAVSLTAWLKGCQTQPAAVQIVSTNGRSMDDVRLILGTRVWSELATDQKIALLVHEYLQAATHSITSSCAVGKIRVLVARILSDEGLELSADEWSRLIPSVCDEDTTRP